jgi:hypothetical protein
MVLVLVLVLVLVAVLVLRSGGRELARRRGRAGGARCVTP